MGQFSSPKIYGVLGYPARHSLSPLMHNAAFRALKIRAEYKIFEKKPKDLEDFLCSLSKNNIHGLNVTVPYKEKVIPFLNNISIQAKLIGAVNAILVHRNRLDGFNTDGGGFLKHITSDLKFNPKGKIVSIIGAGGASKAIAVVLSKTKPQMISIFDIDKAKAAGLVSHLKKNFNDTEFKLANSIETLNIEKSDLLINATPLGMKRDDPCLVSSNLLHKKLLVYDLVYNPCETKLLAIAKNIGAKASNGLGMLLYQGALSFKYFTGRNPPVEIMRQALNKGVKKL